MEYRQPDAAELVIPRCSRVDQAAADIKMRFGIAVIEDKTILKTPPSRNCHNYDQRGNNNNDLVAASRSAAGLRTR